MGTVNRRNRQSHQKCRVIRTGYEVRYLSIARPFIVHFDSLADAKAHRDYLVNERKVEDVVLADLAAGRLVD